VRHRVTSSRFGDFTIDDAITFEIGGPSKTAEQIKGIPNAYIAADGIKGGTGKKIPLWLFGFLYWYEIDCVDSDAFYAYLLELSMHKPKELKVVVIDKAGYHTLKGLKLPDNIKLLNISPCSPELNPCERVWGYIKSFFKTEFLEDMERLRAWLHEFVTNWLNTEGINSLTQNERYTKPFIAHAN
jgi:transposase